MPRLLVEGQGAGTVGAWLPDGRRMESRSQSESVVGDGLTRKQLIGMLSSTVQERRLRGGLEVGQVGANPAAAEGERAMQGEVDGGRLVGVPHVEVERIADTKAARKELIRQLKERAADQRSGRHVQ